MSMPDATFARSPLSIHVDHGRRPESFRLTPERIRPGLVTVRHDESDELERSSGTSPEEKIGVELRSGLGGHALGQHEARTLTGNPDAVHSGHRIEQEDGAHRELTPRAQSPL